MAIDINYLNHDLKQYHEVINHIKTLHWYKCTKCNLLIYYFEFTIPQNNYVYLDLDLTCEEYIIKNIIE